MYRQILLDPTDCQYQLILWRENSLDQLEIYQLKTVTYGTSAAPYLATRCLTKLAEDSCRKYPSASTALLLETYVDDIMTGANTLEQAATLLADLNGCLAQHNLNYHKEPFLRIGDNDVVKMLGLIWHPTAGTFAYHFDFKRTNITTKRTVLSDLGKIFDPLGLIGPVVVLGKIFMQQLWKLNISWDQPLPEDYEKRWKNYVQQLENLNSLQHPRHLLSSAVSKSVQLHSFSDRSEAAYGACCYLRSIDINNKVTVQLICSKSRVAPSKSTSIAKLELQAALLMTELVERLQDIIPMPIEDTIFYTDSKIVLAWIAKPSYTWTTFVANRVAKIQELTRKEEWSYVSSKQNPADIISRGALSEEFINSSLWTSGPEFLHSAALIRPRQPQSDQLDEVPERRPNKLALFSANPAHSDLTTNISHRESLHRLERIVAYGLR
ncbi:PREDICTED: uncharacterized protein LOC108363355, partial [Rhagoletis zephyria]|uniref:uncharacterized protein LOC108363355 n=1 Tax=Rhagoletis zephyria TaxID=28612 RepID=UPI00081140A6